MTRKTVQRGKWRLLAMAAVLAGLVAAVVLVLADGGTLASNAVSMSELEDSPYGVVNLEDHNIFVVATEDGPIALVGDAQHVANDPVWYCPLSDLFEGPYHGGRFDRRGRYASGPPHRDMDRVAVEITGGTVIVDLGNISVSPGRSLVVDPAKGPSCGGTPEQPGFFSAHTAPLAPR